VAGEDLMRLSIRSSANLPCDPANRIASSAPDVQSMHCALEIPDTAKPGGLDTIFSDVPERV